MAYRSPNLYAMQCDSPGIELRCGVQVLDEVIEKSLEITDRTGIRDDNSTSTIFLPICIITKKTLEQSNLRHLSSLSSILLPPLSRFLLPPFQGRWKASKTIERKKKKRIKPQVHPKSQRDETNES
jgi:hypothetical protein